MTQDEQLFKSTEKDESGISLREVMEKYIVHWRWFVLSALVCLILGWLYARYSTPKYESTATVLIDQENPGLASEELGMLKDLGLASSGGALEDEIELYKSRSLMERVVRDLDLNWKYENLGTKTGLVRGELYENNPIRVRSVKSDSLLFEERCELSIVLSSPHEYEVIEGSSLAGKKYRYGAVIRSSVGELIIEKTPEFSSWWAGKSIRITLTPIDLVAGELQDKLSIQPASKDANILVLKMEGHNVEKNNAILNKVIAVHQENAISSKNLVVQNTTSFINDRMKFIAAELTGIEKEGENYKSEHHLVDVTTDAATYLGKEGELEKKVVETSIEMNLAEFMNEVISEQNGYEQLLPANLGFKDPTISQMTTQYNTLVLERNRLRETSGEKHPGVARIESQLASLRSSLETSLRNMKNTSQMQLRKLKSEEAIYQSKISSIPQFEREYRDILRQQQIKESLYLFLLQKREQNEISLAATVANTRVIDPAYSSGQPISPKKKVIYLIAFFIGLLIPVTVIYLRNLLNNKIVNRTDLEGSELTVLGDIPEVKKKEELMAINYPHSSVAEAFRVLRANLSFVLPKEESKCKVISITSSLSGEGKSSTSVNLAFIYAASGKKVLLMGLDLRKPRIKEVLDLEYKVGLSNFLVNENLKKEDIISKSVLMNNSIDVIMAGDIPPNPSELLMSERLDELILELRQEYDYIIMDNAPVGLVIDAVTTNRFADTTLYLIRSGKVDKRFKDRIMEFRKQDKLKHMYVVLNAVKKSGSTYYYTYGYGEHSEQRSWWKRLFAFK